MTRGFGGAVDRSQLAIGPFKELVPLVEVRVDSGLVEAYPLTVVPQEELQFIGDLRFNGRSDFNVEMDALASAVTHLY